jgi:hypothetical protein
MAKIICRKVGRTLVPVDDEGFDALAKVREGRDVTVEFKTPRNPRHHRLFFAIIKFVQDHSERMAGASPDQIKTALKLATGYVETYVDRETGEACYVPKSIAWESCDQTEFAKFFDEACRVIASRWLPEGSTPEDVRRELIEMVDGQYAVGRVA